MYPSVLFKFLTCACITFPKTRYYLYFLKLKVLTLKISLETTFRKIGVSFFFFKEKAKGVPKETSKKGELFYGMGLSLTCQLTQPRLVRSARPSLYQS